jgi:hypothetical protein
MDSNAFQLHLATLPAIDDMLRDGARRALQAAMEREVEEYIERNSGHLDADGHRLVVRNGHHPARMIQSGSRTACLAMAFKLVESAQNHWRKLNGSTLLPAVIAGTIFKDGTKLAA